MSEPETPQTPAEETPPPPPPAGGEWILALVPLLVEKDDAEVQWHAKHGLVLLVAEVILWIVFAILSVVLGPLACALAIVQLLLFLAVIVVHVLCIVKGIGGERFLIPGVSQYADRF
jgi:uncharacterized membrane protein